MPMPTAVVWARGRRDLQRELAALIVGNQIAARIDSDAGALYSHHTDQRASTFHFALKAGETAQNENTAWILQRVAKDACFRVPDDSLRLDAGLSPFTRLQS